MDAMETFEPGGNILAGESDTGKSYLLHCVDYVFGAQKLKKRISEAGEYSDVFVELENSIGDFLTLRRSLSGGKIYVYRSKFEFIAETLPEVANSKRGKSRKIKDISSILFSFAGIPEALLRKNDRGVTQHLSMRMFLPVLLVDEVAIIDERSPVFGKSGYSETAHKRTFSFMISGKDDTGIVTSAEQALVKARSTAQLGVIMGLLAPLEERAEKRLLPGSATSAEIEEAISTFSNQLAAITEVRTSLHSERETSAEELTRAESQIIALDQLLSRYHLLDGRYASDLERLDFVAEGSHYFKELQKTRCPLCDQVIDGAHEHFNEASAERVHQSTRAEAGKILGHRLDLAAAIEAVTLRKQERIMQAASAKASLSRIEDRLSQTVIPSFTEVAALLEDSVSQRIQLERANTERDQIRNLNQLKLQIETAVDAKEVKVAWEELPAAPLRELCSEIEAILVEWSWKGPGRVDFDQNEYDIIVDGHPRQSHGKGVRAILYAAFAIGLLRYCKNKGKPHPGMLVIDSPLTSYKKSKSISTSDGPVDPGVEASFWESLTRLQDGIQVIIVENKEPPQDVADKVHYQWFAGDAANSDERTGLIPKHQSQLMSPAPSLPQ
ncbi:hypothetical protein [Stenotrophomonas maltophilia]|uniref:hypothetical protein n=1 Tax=Stenotrophomonas maltophilia TaxID=40324 RepID=UPI0013D96CEF|nr:hypothetical protein [Stenotrophomonas maltophilia]